MRQKTLLLAFFVLVGFVVQAQQKITGTVTSSEDNLPLPGVSIYVKGNQTVGTATNIDGKYTLTVPQGSETLVFSSVGMQDKEVAIGGQSVIDVTLEPAALEMDEVIVVAYGTTKKQSFTGSASTLKSEQIENVPVSSVDQAIMGTVPGLQVGSSSGQPGSTGQIRIRGVGSFNASNEPLIVIDGVPVTNDDLGSFSSSSSNALATINPSDIANISVLKDAAAASLYGSRAANGVILITTKKGKSGETKFKAKAEWGFSDFATDNVETVSGEKERELKWEGLYNSAIDDGNSEADATAYADNNIGYIAPLDGNYSDWQDKLFRTGVKKNYQVSASGGSEQTTYHASFGYLDEEGVLENSDFERFSGRIRLNHNITDAIEMGANTMLTHSIQNTIPDDGGFYVNPFYATRSYLGPTIPIYNEDGSFYTEIPDSKPNLVKDQGLNMQRNKNYRSMSNAFLSAEIMDGLTAKTTFGLDLIFSDDNRYWSPKSNDGETHNGFGDKRHNIWRGVTSSTTLNYSTSLNDDHNIDILAGYEVESNYSEYTLTEASGYPSETLTAVGIAAKPLTAYNSFSEDRMMSVLSRANYNYMNRYYLSLSYRRDGSSRLSPENRWADFYSVSASWRVSEEKFLQSVTWLNDWKLRASYGTNGTLPSGWYDYMGLYNFNDSYAELPGSAQANIANPELTWEKSKSLNIGTEIKIFQNVTLEMEYFQRTTSDLLLDVPLSKGTGFSTMLQNIGEIKNRGVEININTQNIRTADFVWTSNLNISHFTNEVTELYKGEDIVDFPYIYREGESINSFFLRKYAGVNSQTGHAQWLNADGDITTQTSKAPKRIVGVADPDFYGSFNNNISYKGFDLSFMLYFKVGGKTYDATSYTTQNDGAMFYGPIRESQLDRWQKVGDKTDVPRYVIGNSTNSNYNSDRRLHDADYLRLKNLSLGYNLPEEIVNRANLSNVRLFMAATNLFTWAAYDGYDPEVSPNGTYGWSTPPVKTVTFGIELNF
ncbi:MAG: TonB-dependent receptor [Bacteroidales bacterium]